MSDDLIISATFDGSELYSGIESAASKIQASVGSMLESFGIIEEKVLEVEQAIQEVGPAFEGSLSPALDILEEAGLVSAAFGENLGSGLGVLELSTQEVSDLSESLNSLLGPLGATGEGAYAAAEQLSLFGQAELNAATSGDYVTNLVETLNASLAETTANLGVTLDALAGSIGEVGVAAQSSAEQIALYGLVASDTDAALLQMAEAQTATAESSTGLAEAQAQIPPVVQATATVITDMNSALLAMAEAHAEATAAEDAAVAAHLAALDAYQNSAEQAVDIMAAYQVEAASEAAAVEEAASAIQAYSVSVAEGVTVTQAMQKAIDFLNNEEAVASATAQQLAAAQNLVATGAQRLGLEVEKTATGWQLFAGSVEEARTALTSFQSQVAYSGARLAAYELGIGQVGFALGGLARQSTLVATVLQYAFPIIGAVAIYDVVSNLIDKFEKLESDIVKTQAEWTDLGAASERTANQIELQNLKLEDQIAKYEGRPNSNRLKEAAIESKEAVDALNKSLEDTAAKMYTLLETKEIGFFTALITGRESTRDITSKLGDLTLAYQGALDEERLARNAVEEGETAETKARLKGAEDAVAAARQKALGVAEQLEKEKEAKRQALIEQLTAGYTEVRTIAPGASANVPIPGIDLAAATAKANLQFGPALAQLANYITALKEAKTATDALAIANQNRGKVSDEATAADLYARLKTEADAKIKVVEQTGRDTAAIERQTATDNYKTLEASLREQIELQTAGGETRAEAEQAISQKILTARQNLTTQLLAAQRLEYTAESAALEQRKRLIEADPSNGPQKAAALTAVNSQIEALERDNNAKRAEIALQGGAAIEQIVANQKKDEIEIRKNANAEIISNERNAITDLINSFRTDTGAIAAAQAQASEEDRLYKAKESLKLITVQQAAADRIQVYKDEREKVNEILGQELSDLQASLEHINDVRESQVWDTASAKEIDTLYRRISEAITEIIRKRDELNAKNDKAQVDISIEAWENYQKAISSFINSSVSGFESFANSVVNTNKSILSDFQTLFNHISTSFVEMIFKMIEQSALIQGIERTFHNVFDNIFQRIGLGRPNPAGGAGGAAGTVAGAAGGAAGTTAGTQAEIAHTAAIHGTTAALAAFTNALGLGTRAELSKVPITQASNVATTTATAAKTAEVAPVTASTVAHTANATAAATGAAAHGANAGAVTSGTVAHTIHTPAVLSNAAAFIAHEAAVVADTIAIVVHKVVSLLGFEEGGIVPHTGIHFLHEGERVLSVSDRAKFEALSPQQRFAIASEGFNPAPNVGFAPQPTGAAGGGQGGGVAIHLGGVQALDSDGVAGVMKRSRKEIAKQVQRMIHTGHINVRRGF